VFCGNCRSFFWSIKRLLFWLRLWIKINVFWNVTACSLVAIYKCFTTTYWLHRQGRRVRHTEQSRNFPTRRHIPEDSSLSNCSNDITAQRVFSVATNSWYLYHIMTTHKSILFTKTCSYQVLRKSHVKVKYLLTATLINAVTVQLKMLSLSLR
jgi:hypothetical protein